MTHASPHKTWTVFKQFVRSLISLSFSLSAGSLLLDSLKEHISTTAQDHCKAIYLHVLTTNNTAIHFYENRDFKQHHYLPYYYSIRGVLKDGFTYVLYINGGHPPWTILYPFLYLTYLCSCRICLWVWIIKAIGKLHVMLVADKIVIIINDTESFYPIMY